MGSKVTIEGKEYTERVIQSLEINGTTSPNNLIDATSIENNYIVEVNINTGEEIRTSSSDGNIKVQSIEVDNTLEYKNIEKVEYISLISKFVQFIKKLFKI